MSENNYSVKLTPIASDDLDNIYNYIASTLFNVDAANNLLEKIESNIMRLKDFPYSCNYVDDEYLKAKGYRKLIVDNYVAFYLVDEIKKQVVISRVLYIRQQYQNLL